MSFATDSPKYNRSDTANRTGASYLKITPEYRVVARILDGNARLLWKHFIPQAQKGKGTGVVCPNQTPFDTLCPIENAAKELLADGLIEKDSQEYKDSRARKRFLVNVLDRTPYTVCEKCEESTPGKKCQNCGADLKKAVFAPLNKVKILEGGPRLFLETLNSIDQLQQEESELAITDYDITFSAQGEMRDKKISAIPQAASELSEDDLLDLETNEPQKLYDLELLAEPTPIDDILAFLDGKTVQEVNESHQVTTA